MISLKRAYEIIDMVNKLKEEHGTNDPGAICKELNIKIRKISLNPEPMKAYTLKIEGKPHISINTKFTLKSQKVLCAHELGHAQLHDQKYYNYYGGENTVEEHEAHLFAVALLFNQEDFDVPIYKMSSSELKYILDSNLKLNPYNWHEYGYYPSISY
ncbi:MAG: ImmA/IrrE family metallo-endopeptidase [Clostridium sp.]